MFANTGCGGLPREIFMFFETYTDRKKQYRWRLKAANGKIVASGESYKQQAGRDKAIELMRHLFEVPIKEVKN